jgi:hypothetical protein
VVNKVYGLTIDFDYLGGLLVIYPFLTFHKANRSLDIIAQKGRVNNFSESRTYSTDLLTPSGTASIVSAGLQSAT